MSVARLAALIASEVGGPGAAHREDARAVREDWSAIAATAAAHRLSAVAVRAIPRTPHPETNPGISALRSDARGTAAKALALIAPLQELVAALDAREIPHLLWKGPGLAVQAWGDLGARDCSDLDLVVAPGDRRRAREAAGALGWSPVDAMSPAQEAAILRGRGAWELQHGSHATLLELHWEFSALRYPGRLPTAAVIARAVTLTVGGARVRVPEPADSLVLLAQHATKHGWSSLEDVAVFAAMLAREPDAVLTAAERARGVGGLRALRLGVALAERFFAVVAPESFRSSVLGDPAIEPLVQAVEARLDSGEVAWRATLAWDLAWAYRRRDLARLLARSLFDPTRQEWLVVELPDALLPLYRVIRPARLVGRALARSLSR